MPATSLEFDIEAFLEQELQKGLLRFTTAGSVDDGKSTLIGRLLHDAHGAYEDHLQSIRSDSGVIDFALLTDGLRAEREQGITIDVAYRYFATPRRKFILADTPGHVQYTRNMATGASTADLAIILLDAKRGIAPQSRRHASIAALLGIPHFLIAINKMDMVDYDQEVFLRLCEEFEPFLATLGVRGAYFLPISALEGDNVVTPSGRMDWFDGPTLLEHLETVERAPIVKSDFRMPVSRVIRPDQTFRGYSGQVASGTIRPGDEVTAMVSGQRSHVSRIVTYDGDLEEANAPLSITLTLADEIDISRGDMLVSGKPPRVSRSINATVVWFDNLALDTDCEYLVKHSTQTVRGRVTAESNLLMNDIGLVSISLSQPLFTDEYTMNRISGSFILIDPNTNATAAAGMILSD